MKKRLLITSIVMMLVVAVALSTATYAWFTSNASVTASTVTMTAATNANAALGISWTTSDYGTEISGSFNGGTLQPMAPTAYTVGTTTVSSGANQIAFNTATIKSDPTHGMIFGSAGAPATAYTWNDDTNYSFHVKNLAPSGTTNLTVTVTATIGGTAADLARVAIFQDDKLLGVIANRVAAGAGTTVNGVKYYESATSSSYVSGDGTAAIPANSYVDAKVAKGAISNNGVVAEFPTVDAVTSVSYTLNADTDSEIVVMMWLDGALFDETRSTETATVALSFNGAKIVQ